jgi:hypothetical protein
MTHRLRSTGITPLHHYYGAVRPSPAHQYFRPRGWRRLCLFPWHRRPGSHVPYKSLIELRAAYMPDAAWAVSVHPQVYPGRRVNPRFWHRLIRFRHFIDGSLALASLNRACRDHVPTSPQRSPPSLLTTAACGGLRSTPDCRPRRALLHLSYSCASPCGPAMLVTQDPDRTLSGPAGLFAKRQMNGVCCAGQFWLQPQSSMSRDPS